MTRKPKPPEDFLYTLHTGAESFIITKYDSIGLEQLSQYIMPVAFDDAGDPVLGCTCPQGLKPTCRHRRMFPALKPYTDLPIFYRYGDDTFHAILEGSLQHLTSEQLANLRRVWGEDIDTSETDEVEAEIARIEAAKAAASASLASRPATITIDGESVTVKPVDPAPFKRRF